jgi:hypothetical protein
MDPRCQAVHATWTVKLETSVYPTPATKPNHLFRVEATPKTPWQRRQAHFRIFRPLDREFLENQSFTSLLDQPVYASKLDSCGFKDELP